MCYVCANTSCLWKCESRKKRIWRLATLLQICRLSQTNKLNIHTQKHTYIIVPSYPKSWNQVTMMSWPHSKVCSSVYCSLLTGLPTQISPCSVWLTCFRPIFLACQPSHPQTLANGACTMLHPLPLHLPSASHHLTLSVSLHLTWHLCDVMVNTSPHAVLPSCPLLQALHVRVSCSLHLERSSLLLCKILTPCTPSMRFPPWHLHAHPSIVKHSFFSATLPVHSISFVFYECVCLFEIKYLYICLSQRQYVSPRSDSHYFSDFSSPLLILREPWT